MAGDKAIEIALVGDLTEQEADITSRLLDIPYGGPCLLYFDSPGGSSYVGLALMSLIIMRDLQATGIVMGECSSAALWPLAACKRRIVTSLSVLLFHPLKWQSEEHVGLAEAAEWARHFAILEADMDRLLAQLLRTSDELIAQWMTPGRYVSGREFADAGLGELVELAPLASIRQLTTAPRRKRPQ